MTDAHRPEVRAIPVICYCTTKARRRNPDDLRRQRSGLATRRRAARYQGLSEMDLYDSMHPRSRAALEAAALNFDLKTMPAVALYWAVAAPTRFLAWLEAEVEHALSKESS